jgi:hypothetical protein
MDTELHTYDKPYHPVYGEKGMFVTKADRAPSAAFVESGIEALSYRALRGTGPVFSTTGSAVDLPAKMGSLLQAWGYAMPMSVGSGTGAPTLGSGFMPRVMARVTNGKVVHPTPQNEGKGCRAQMGVQNGSRGHGSGDSRPLSCWWQK